MQHAQQPRQRVVAVVGVDAIRTRQLRSPAQRIVAEAELAGQRVGQRRQPVQRVVVVGVGRPVGRGQGLAVRRRVVSVEFGVSSVCPRISLRGQTVPELSTFPVRLANYFR